MSGIVTNTVPELTAATAAVGTATGSFPFDSIETTVVTVATAGIAVLIRKFFGWLKAKFQKP